MADIPHIYIKDRKTWRQWLSKNHETYDAIWLVYDTGKGRQLSWQDIVQEALCFGWIDSRPAKYSETQSRLYLSKRKPTSGWSKINKQSVEVLLQQALIMPAGLAAIETAKQNGAWNKLNRSDNLEIPADLSQLFATDPQAHAHFSAFSDSSKRLILEWIYAAKRDVTRSSRIEKTVAMAHDNLKAHQYLRKL